MKIKLYLTSRQVAVQAGAHPQQVARLTQRGVIKPAAATESGLKLFEPNTVRIVLRARSAMNRNLSLPEFKQLTHEQRNDFFRKGGHLKG